MTKTKTVTEQTIHGSIEYEIVECDSCGETVKKDDAQQFIIGNIRSSRYKFDKKQIRFEKGEEPVIGWCCPYCRDAGPMDYPSLTVPEKIKQLWSWWFTDRYGLTFRGVVTLCIVGTLGLIVLTSFL